MYPFLFAAALVGGALNAVAGGGSFIALPALISAGIAPVTANATTTFALWPGAVSSAVAYRRDVASARHSVLGLATASLAGGLLGAWLLIRTSDARFLRLLPWLMLAAALTFTLGRRLTARLRPASPADGGTPSVPVGILVIQFIIAAYGGYFGGGMGIMMLAALAVAGLTDMHAMNGIKAILAVAINGIALVAFVASGAIAWTPGLVMAAGSIAGGFFGAYGARQIDPGKIRIFVVAMAWLMTGYFFVRG